MDLKGIMGMIKSVLVMLAPQLKKADSQHGVQELSEAISGVNELGLVLAKMLKDGFQVVDDAAMLWNELGNNAQVKDALQKAVQGLGNVPQEVKDLDVGEGLELGALVVDYVPKYVDALKKDPVAPQA